MLHIDRISDWRIGMAAWALAMLAVAQGFERIGGYPPCELCLWQRDIYWAIAGSCLLSIVLGGRAGRADPKRPTAALLSILFLGEAVLAGYHAGIEWSWWAGPSTCTALGKDQSSFDNFARTLAGPARVIACDQAAWRLFGLSMAGWNALLSFAACLVNLRIYASSTSRPGRALGAQAGVGRS